MTENAIAGLKIEALEAAQIISYTLTSAQTTTISAWSEIAVNRLKEWPKDRPYLALHDLSHPGVGLLYLTAVEFDPFNVGITPTGRQAAHELMAAHAGWPVVLALVVSTSLSGRLTRLRMADIISDLPKITSRTFFKRAAALEWLQRHQQGLEPVKTPSHAAVPVTVVPATTPVNTVPVTPLAVPSLAPATGSTPPEPLVKPDGTT
jgi:hypothetical protein